MVFNSIRFMAFLLLVLIAHRATPPRWRWLVLVIAGYLFYASFSPAHCLLLLLISLTTYATAILIQGSPTPARRRAWMAACLTLNLGLLLWLKYYNFFLETISRSLEGLGLPHLPGLGWVLPVGLSFYTLQTASYVIDVYRGDLPPERHAGRYLAYAGFFPVLLAGPITRGGVLLPQLASPPPWRSEEFAAGARQILLGLFKKAVIADRLAIFVDDVYHHPHDFSGLYLIIPTVAFCLQIYYDFSGYTDMAIGTARLLGYRLQDNFRRPYAATSFTDFWRRWHISLSTWFRDYLYIPLGGNRRGSVRRMANLLVVFALSGLWHGASWTFVAWGLMHGLLLAAEVSTAGLRARLTRPWAQGAPWLAGLLGWVVTFVGVTAAWAFFRAGSIGDAFYILGHSLSRLGDFSWNEFFKMGLGRLEWTAIIICVVFNEALSWAEARESRWALASLPTPLRWAAYYFVLTSIVLLGAMEKVDFVYMRF